MLILHVGNVPQPEEWADKVGRAKNPLGRWVLNHALAQKRAGLNVEVVSQAHKARQDFIADIEGVRVHFLRTFHPYRHLTFYVLDAWRMARYIRSLHPDIVHAHLTEAAYALAAIRSSFPFCVTAQGLFFQILPTLPKGLHLNERFIRVSEHWAWKHTHYAIAKSEYVREALAKEYPHLDLSLIPNTYQPELEAPPLPDTIRRPHDLVFVGSMDPRKGIDLLSDAVRTVNEKVPDVRMHFIGNAPEGQGSPFENAQVASLRSVLGDRLVLHGRQRAANLFHLLDACSILLAPSREEMFGNQLIEGLMRGCHGIVTERTALAENVRRFGNGTIVPQNDGAALAAAILARFHAPQTEEEAHRAIERIRAYMAPSTVATEHLRLYERILSKA